MMESAYAVAPRCRVRGSGVGDIGGTGQTGVWRSLRRSHVCSPGRQQLANFYACPALNMACPYPDSKPMASHLRMVSMLREALREVGGDMRVLIVEDDTAIRTLIHEILGDDGHEVMVATDGYHGVLLARESVPDIILMDINMPVMDGIMASHLIKEVIELSSTVIVAMSAGSNLRQHADEMDADGILEKPFGIDDLLDVVHSFV
jgi:two-component system, cell cycle response regulator DivK